MNPSHRALRALDCTLLFLSVPLWSLALGTTALACIVTQGRPVLFVQPRIGRDGRTFLIYKFRTMIPDADLHLDSKGLPIGQRVTRTGAILRRIGIDELPQVINVLKGDMSLVGPRPVLPEWLARIPGGAEHPRFRTRPGITGLAQVAGRNSVLWSRRLALDARWATEAGVPLYLATLAKTPATIGRQTVSPDRNPGEVNDLDDRGGSP